jgi:thymidylate synthase
MMNSADKQYLDLVRNIIKHGYSDEGENVRPKWADGTPAYTKSLISCKMQFDNSEVPILTTKQVAWKTSIKELLWIWQMKSNRIEDLHKMNVHIWDEWEIKEGKWAGTIGPAYGYQLGKKCRKVNGELLDQVDYLLWSLKNNPSRRMITTLWDKDDLDEMALTPCVWKTNWLVKGRKLHLIVGIRSNDMALGNPFNVFQYSVLQRMIAQVTGYELGTLTFDIDDAHVYDRHIEPLKQQLEREPYPAPKIWINPEITNFYDFTPDDIKLIDYKHHPKIEMEVAI